MKKSSKKIIVIILILTIAIVGFISYACFFSTDVIDGQEEIASYTSPEGTYQLVIFRNDGGATTSYAVLGVLYKNDDSNYSRNIYWENRQDDADVEWLDDDTVIINGHRIENVEKDKFDFRYNKDELLYQNQFLYLFDIDFISSKCKAIEKDDFRNFISINLNETEIKKIQEFIENDNFYSISKRESDYIIVNKILNRDFTKDIPQISNGSFSIYNQTTQKMIDLDNDDISMMDFSYYTVLTYDTDNQILYAFDYEMS